MGDALQTLLDWIDVDSTSGREGDYGDAVGRHLESLGFDVEHQRVAPGRSNLLARTGRPEVVLCTHLDTVPPFIGPSADRTHVHGRGSCDAKGPALAMIEAARGLLDEGERRVGLLFTVGEEVDGIGASTANERLAEPWAPRFTIVGEPTGNRFVRGHKGIFKCCLRSRGVAGHSSQPIGPSAVHDLVGTLARALAAPWGEHELFGRGTLNVGVLAGGAAANVVADRASAELVLRAVEQPDVVRERLRGCLGAETELTDEKSYGPVSFHVPDGAPDAGVVAFGTDAPFLPSWGTPLLFGPGHIEDAHTDHERLERRAFDDAVGVYAETSRALLRKA